MINWLDRAMILGPHICLVTSQKDYNMALRHCKQEVVGDLFIKNAQAGATLHWIDRSEKLICIVAIRPVGPEIEGIPIAALLVHEAVHIWQKYCERIGEHTPSDEFMAYGIQFLSQELMYAYVKATK